MAGTPESTGWSSTKHRLGLWAAASLGRWFGPGHDNSVGILMYHRIADPVEGLPPPTWNVSPGRFKSQLKGLLKRGFTPVSLSRVLDASASGAPLPRKSFVVTFDDGYECVHRRAWPTLKALGVPATVFLATGYLDSREPAPFDDWSAKGDPRAPDDAWRLMTVDQCRDMAGDGLVEFGAHTHTHDDFRGRPEALAADLDKCLYFLRDALGLNAPSFAFPYGTKRTGHSGGALTEVVRGSGARCALTTEWRMVGPKDDPFDWGRFTAEGNDTAETLAGKLTGWFTRLHDFAERLLGGARRDRAATAKGNSRA